ncbi:alpha-hydroxy-acid oxidizing protein [Afifella sp. JA880]|uniref:alpha-hydroxy-acid oxidizing protein n=1 Tax=Afifella sp. JA880 TaxID=2975280 RepID=UPI0021BB4A0F|nr:alpha-hydroxy-acid oxidizing protein [Afifella sp. JA880]MCT8266295.1 alpha-hydroxy-acid oxidizing protein [Afifella sp. JA880]
MTGMGRRRQTAIFMDGLMGRRQKVPAAPKMLEQNALSAMGANAAAYIAGSAGMEQTAAANRAAFDRYPILQRMLNNVAERDLTTTLPWCRLPLPLLLAPIGVLEMAHRQADLAAARAATSAGVPFVTSSQSSFPMEEIARACGAGERWFQLYWSSSNELTESFVTRAERAGYGAIVVTLDTTQLGWRPRDLDGGYLPFLRGRGIANYLSDPVFQELIKESSDRQPLPLPGPGALRSALELLRSWPQGARRAVFSGKTLSAIRRFIATYSRPDLAWDDLTFLRQRTRLPILLKGIVHPDDARQAVDAGVDGIIVSNHGGRQVDGALAALDALPGVAAAVNGRIPILFDSGIRTGADILKAKALGAAAVLIGRPYVYGLALAGERGVREVIDNLSADLDLTMALCGHGSFTALGRELLARSP